MSKTIKYVVILKYINEKHTKKEELFLLENNYKRFADRESAMNFSLWCSEYCANKRLRISNHIEGYKL